MFRFKFSGKILFMLLTVISLVFAAPETDELNGEQKKMQADIEHSLVAPCCWNMTVDHHDSPKSRAVRSKITELIKQGKSKDEILKYFSARPEYGERILATPSQDTWLGKSAYWMIPVAILLGAFLIIFSLKKWTRKEEQITGGNAASPKKGENKTYSEKVEKELKALE